MLNIILETAGTLVVSIPLVHVLGWVFALSLAAGVEVLYFSWIGCLAVGGLRLLWHWTQTPASDRDA